MALGKLWFKQFKNVLIYILNVLRRKSNLRTPEALFGLLLNALKFTAITPASPFIPYFDPFLAVGVPHDRDSHVKTRLPV